MARTARIVVPGYPHHITQRGNRRQQTFFCDDDYRAYLELVSQWCQKHGTDIWAYCLMPNHVHLIVVPQSADGLRLSIGEAHRRYTRRINIREGWRGHLWQERFSSFVMDESHLLSAVRYVELNPVRARLVRKPWRWRWSSAAAHVARKDDTLVKVAPMLELVEPFVDDWQAYLALETPEETIERLQMHGRTGRPLGNGRFMDKLENLLGRTVRPGKPGRPTKKTTKKSVKKITKKSAKKKIKGKSAKKPKAKRK